MSDVARLRYVFPKFHHGYNAMMKTLTSALKYESSDPAKFRLKVLAYGKNHGVASTLEAYGVSRRTYFYWLAAFTHSKGRLVSLVPKSTAPHHTRRMEVDPRLLDLIKSVREEYGRVGKEKLKILLGAYAQSLGIAGYSAGKIGKIIKRHRYFFDFTRTRNKHAFARQRVRRVAKDVKPGYIEMDSIIIYLGNTKLRFITMLDVVTRVAYAKRVKSGLAKHTIQALQTFQAQYHLPIRTIQTDNGSEFLGDFHDHLEKQHITHLFTYPHSPKVNGMIERFNRTIQEEFIERCEAWWLDPLKGDQKLIRYLNWYNDVRPHSSLKYATPREYAKQYR